LSVEVRSCHGAVGTLTSLFGLLVKVAPGLSHSTVCTHVVACCLSVCLCDYCTGHVDEPSCKNGRTVRDALLGSRLAWTQASYV